MTLRRFFCESCGKRFDQVGNCPTCSGEPLLDLADADVRNMLEELDDKARLGRYGKVFMVSAFVGALVYLPSMAFLGWLIAFVPAVGVAAALTAVGTKLFPAKRSVPELSDDELRQLQAL